jgi:hypothetical protein
LRSTGKKWTLYAFQERVSHAGAVSRWSEGWQGLLSSRIPCPASSLLSSPAALSPLHFRHEFA